MIGTTAALVGSAAVGAGTSILGGIFGSRAANKAAKIQAEAAARVADEARNTAAFSADDVTRASEEAALNVTDVGGRAAGRVDAATSAANQTLRDVYNEAQAATDPYRTAGANAVTALTDASATGADQFKFSQDDPSFQFRLKEGLQALERSAAARGVLASGGTLKALNNYAQESASHEYGNAFNRFMAQRGQRLSTLKDLAGIGLSGTEGFLRAGSEFGGRTSANLTRGAETVGGFETGAAESAGRFRVGGSEAAGGFRMRGSEIAGNAITGGANAQAAGKIGAANAWGGAMAGVGNAAQIFALRELLKPKP